MSQTRDFATYPDLAISHIPTLGSKILHPIQRQLAQIPILDTRRNERHRNVPLDTVDTRPRRHERQDPRDDIHERVGRVVFVLSRAPEFVKTGSADDERRVQFKAVRSESRVLEEFLNAGA